MMPVMPAGLQNVGAQRTRGGFDQNQAKTLLEHVFPLLKYHTTEKTPNAHYPWVRLNCSNRLSPISSMRQRDPASPRGRSGAPRSA